MRRVVWLLLGLAAAPAAWAQPRAYREADVQAVVEDLRREPSIQEVQRAALEFYRVDPATVDSLRSRAGWKSVLPAVRLAGRRNISAVHLDRLNVEAFSATEPATVDDVEGTVNELVIEGSWDLPRLVFNAEVLDVTSLALLQENLLKEVTRLYYARRRLQIDLALDPPTDAATRLTKELRLEELTATLDAMTGSLYTRHARRARR